MQTETSPTPTNGVGSSVSRLPFLRPSDLYGDDGEDDWLVEDYLVPGDKTVISARPKAGKSTLAFAWSAALLRDVDEFLGKRIDGSSVGVLYCTEEPSKKGLGAKAQRFNLTDHDPFYVLRRVDVYGEKWPDIVEALAQAAKELKDEWGVERMLVVIDGLAKWAGFESDQENDAGVTRDALVELDRLLGDGHAVLVLHHAGWNADRERGSSAIAGEAGIRLFIDGEGNEPRRIVHKGGRHGWCNDVTYSLTDDGFETLGSAPPKRAAGLAEILGIIDELGRPTTQEIISRASASGTTVRARLDRLKALSKVRPIDEGQGGQRRRVWERTSPLDLLFGAKAE